MLLSGLVIVGWLKYGIHMILANPTSDLKYTELFVPEKSGYIYYKAKFLWIESERGEVYIKTYQDILKEAGITEGKLPDGTVNNPIKKNLLMIQKELKHQR